MCLQSYSETYLIFTLLYCTVGLALTTIAIEIAADYLKRLHYFGRKMDNVGNVQIWFGGQKWVKIVVTLEHSLT